MNLENVKALADVLCAKGLSAIEVGEGENRIRIEREITTSLTPAQPIVATNQAEQANNVTAPAASAIPATPDTNTQENNQSVDFNHLIEVKSPLVGVYYAAPSPDSETFVSIGSKVKKGDVLCIIETMKLMNEIHAENDGEIVDICIKNGDIAEYGQVLFKMY